MHFTFEKQKGLVRKVRERLAGLSDEESFNPNELADYFDLDAYIKLRQRFAATFGFLDGQRWVLERAS